MKGSAGKAGKNKRAKKVKTLVKKESLIPKQFRKLKNPLNPLVHHKPRAKILQRKTIHLFLITAMRLAAEALKNLRILQKEIQKNHRVTLLTSHKTRAIKNPKIDKGIKLK